MTTADARYAVPLAALAKSIDRNLQTCLPATLHVIDGGLGWRNRRRIENSLSPSRLRVVWRKPPSGDALAGVPVFGHINISTYYRILVPRICAELDKVIYLDADTLVVGDLGELWSCPMGDLPLLAVRGDGGTLASMGIPGYGELGLNGSTKALNAGVLVMDLVRWRQASYDARILQFLRKHAGQIKFWDQDGINVVLAGQWGELDQEWNWRIDCGQPSLASDVAAAFRGHSVRVIHFASAMKPWHYYCEHPARSLFFAALRGTAFEYWTPRPPLRALLNRHYWGAKARRWPLLRGVMNAVRPRSL